MNKSLNKPFYFDGQILYYQLPTYEIYVENGLLWIHYGVHKISFTNTEDELSSVWKMFCGFFERGIRLEL